MRRGGRRTLPLSSARFCRLRPFICTAQVPTVANHIAYANLCCGLGCLKKTISFMQTEPSFRKSVAKFIFHIFHRKIWAIFFSGGVDPTSNDPRTATQFNTRGPSHNLTPTSNERLRKAAVRRLRRSRYAGQPRRRHDAACADATSATSAHPTARSMYEASGLCTGFKKKVFAVTVTSASSDVPAALPAAAICASCKPALLCSDGCSAAAVHGTYGSRDHWSVSPSASWATAVPTKASALARACVTACA